MLLLGALTPVREREQGNWKALLSTATDGIDTLVGKLMPYLFAGVLQAAAVALLAIAHLLLGFALSALTATQLQAIQSAVFFYLPSMLLSGFMFPFTGMPGWARWIGERPPLTHFVRTARGNMLRGADLHALQIEPTVRTG
jgi:ABC-2 type transport system permease protein